MFIASDGTVSYGTRVTLNLACHLHLQNYPLDRQTCVVKILSCELFFLQKTAEKMFACFPQYLPISKS